MSPDPHQKRLLSGGAVGRDMVTLVRVAEPVTIEVATFRESRRGRPVGAPRSREAVEAPTPPPAPKNDVDVERARSQAYEEGFAAGQATAASAAEQMFERFEGAIEHLQRALATTEKSAQEDCVRLALRIGETLTRQALTSNPDAIVAAVSHAVEHIGTDAPLKIACDAATAIGLKMQLDELVSSLGVPGIEVTEDASLAPGDLMLTSGVVALDARVDTGIGRIEQALRRELGMPADEAAAAGG
ncbi:MAG: FliH/SctL family protein [Deltaproteobacteria bacterium]